MSGAVDTSTRRRWERAVPTTHIGVAIQGAGLPFTLRNLSYGGFAIVSGQPFTPGAEARFTFSEHRTGLWLHITARAAHSSLIPGGGHPQYFSGWEFLLTGDDEEQIKVLFDDAAGRTADATKTSPALRPVPRASRSKRARRSRSTVNAAGRTLSATSRFRRESRAR